MSVMKPCPECGSNKVYIDGLPPEYYGECKKCNYRRGNYKTVEAAEIGWNEREMNENHDSRYLRVVAAYQELETAVRDLYYQDGDLGKVWVDALTAVQWLKQQKETS